MLTIIFEPHATTLDNENKVASGWNDTALSSLGEQQARELGERYVDAPFAAVFCSDLQRSHKTAELAFSDAYPIVTDNHLRECNYGDLNGASKQDVEIYKEAALTVPFPNGESYQDTADRMRSFLCDVFCQYDGKTIIIIGHRATQYGLEHWINDVALKNIVLAPWHWQPGWRYGLRQGMTSCPGAREL
jgi:broad specificity phosphatase PhoE